ncbi:MAG: hypothetical protein U9M89_03405 [Patescibacteria group bacterium]|nr:hypothetical protein [Patescibacteria group bacterium]
MSLFTSLVVGAIIFAAIVSNFQRITTSQEAKYNRKSSQEIDYLYRSHLDNIPNNIDYKTNLGINGGVNPAVYLGPDSDRDGITDEAEINFGTNPFNPDTDNDGESDGSEIINGTDPLNPEEGGVKEPPPATIEEPPDNEQPPTTLITVDAFDKEVRSITHNSYDWQEYLIASNNEDISFHISFTAKNTNSQDATLTISDYIAPGIIYTPNSGKLYVGDNEPITLADSWVNGHNIGILADTDTPIEISIIFDAKTSLAIPTAGMTTLNRAMLVAPGNLETDTVHVQIKPS